MTSPLDPAPLILEEDDFRGSQPVVKTPPSPPKRARKELRGLLSDAVYVSSMYQICFADVGGHSSEEEEEEEEVSWVFGSCLPILLSRYEPFLPFAKLQNHFWRSLQL